MKSTIRKIVFLVLELPGLAAVFLSFTWSTSPWQVVATPLRQLLRVRPNESFANWEFFLLGAPLFLAGPVVLLSLRQWFAKPLTKSESWIAYLLGLAGSLATIGWIVFWMVRDPNIREKWALTLPTLVLAAGLLVVTVAIIKRLPREWAAPLALRCGYFANAFFCLVAFSEYFRRVSDLDSGAALVAATVVVYLVEAGYFAVRGWKSRAASGNPA